MKRFIASLLIILGIIFALGAFEQENAGLLALFGLMGLGMVFVGAKVLNE